LDYTKITNPYFYVNPKAYRMVSEGLGGTEGGEIQGKVFIQRLLQGRDTGFDLISEQCLMDMTKEPRAK